MILRPATGADAPAMAALYARSVRALGARDYASEQVEAWIANGPTAERFGQKLADGRRCWIACDEHGGPMGFADLEPDGHVDFLYVDPEAAGRGIAGRLLDAIEAAARARGLTRLHVEASETAKPVFLKRGWVIVARRDFDVAGVAIHNWAMELTL